MTSLDFTTEVYLEPSDTTLTGGSIVPTVPSGGSTVEFVTSVPNLGAGVGITLHVTGTFRADATNLYSVATDDSSYGGGSSTFTLLYNPSGNPGGTSAQTLDIALGSGLGGSGADYDGAVASGDTFIYWSINGNALLSIDSITYETTGGGGGGGGSVTATTQAVTAVTHGGGTPSYEAMELVIADDSQLRAPTSVQVTLNGAESGEQIDFTLDAADDIIFSHDATEEGTLFLVSVPIPEAIGDPETTGFWVDAGTHTLHATSASDKTASDTFTLARDTTHYPAARAADVDPVEIDGRGHSWALQDPYPGGLGSWVMPISPTSQSLPLTTKDVDVDHSTHPIDGRYNLFVGEGSVLSWSWSGYCPDQEFDEKMTAYAELNRRFYVIDHRDRAWKATILRYDPKLRKRQLQDDGTPQDWAADYTVTAVIFDGPFTPVAP